MPPERLRCANSSLLIHSPAKYLLRARMVRGQPCPCRAYTAVQNDTQNEGTTTHAMKKHKAGAAADNAAGSFLRASEENSALMSEQRPGCGPCSRPGKSLPGKHSRKGEGPDRGTGRGREGRGGGQSGKTVTGERSESRWGEGSHTGPPRPGPLLCSRAVLRK